ncbi:sugar kinase [Streptantibioticus silvisoli]|uniref:Sugar kinase n=1 Tax=Streptantibioticus silvisoli TaxID=2705255 RepID=A0ABT6W786_9ACTN|nr:sugar kinase [Streptantibioticus silvisoli]MDI5966598.1 sugar kinase [Streptantibioticus silvisoli]
MAEVVAIGETMALVTPVRPEPLETAELFRVEAGGAESTVALYLRELGHSTAWVSRLGDDPLGRRVLAALERHGVDTSRVTLDPGAPTGVYFKDPGPDGTAVHYYRAGSAASRLSPADLAGVAPDGTRVIHLSGITAALSDSCRALVREVLDRFAGRSPAGAAGAAAGATSGTGPATADRGTGEAGTGAGPLVSFDVNHRPGLWSAGTAAPVLLELARRADVVFVGRDEAQTLWGTATAEDVRALLPEPAHLVVKDGAVGATDFHDALPGGAVFAAAHPIEVVEAVGAGDAFAAGYLAGLLDGEGSAGRLRLGHRLAARSLAGTADFVPTADR